VREVETNRRLTAIARPFALSPSYTLLTLPRTTTRQSTMSSANFRLNNLINTLAPTPTESTTTMSVPIDNEIKGKLALVTGASGG